MPHLIPQISVERYSAGPSASTVSKAKQLQEKVREIIGSEYETILQGSYRNDTAVRDIDDVDIVVIAKHAQSGVFCTVSPGMATITWDTIYSRIEKALINHSPFYGKVHRHNKCIRLQGELNCDIVPAVKISDPSKDPVAIYSWKDGKEFQNFPRTHYENGVAKNQRCQQRYKPAVRMLKAWADKAFSSAASHICPSFYLECIVYSAPDECFSGDKAEMFSAIIKHAGSISYSHDRVLSIAGDKDILVETEWASSNFHAFQDAFSESGRYVDAALFAASAISSAEYWKRAFNDA